MVRILKLTKVHQPIELAYDGEGLRIDGDLNPRKKLKAERTCCCVPMPPPAQEDPTLLPIPNLNILNAFYNPKTNMVQIHALIPREQDKEDTPLDLYKFMYTVHDNKEDEAIDFCEAMIADVYKGLKREKSLKVLINPFGGQGKARDIYNTHVSPIFESAKCKVDVEYTEFQGHAIKIAKDLDIEAFDAIVSVSGDGIPHEIINGYMQRPDATEAMNKVPLGVIPGGTGNALSVCLLGEKQGFDPAYTALQIIKGTSMALDLCSISYSDHRYFSFLSQNYGITAYADLGTEDMRWMGDARTIVGLMKGIFGKHTYPVEIALQIEESNKDKIKHDYETAYSSQTNVLVDNTPGFKDTIPSLSERVPDTWTIIKEPVSFFLTSKTPWLARDMLSHPFALPNDGLLDVLMVRGKNSITKQLGVFTKVESGQHVSSNLVTIIDSYLF
ncbi:ATP-NAD kinase-like domain-containing protein [Phycomyces nitens]|nr:ATP-NAD kinase-like domain-containing protein [Phycomyces nitens]